MPSLEIRTSRYSSAIGIHIRFHSTEVHVNYCQAGSQVGFKTYDKQQLSHWCSAELGAVLAFSIMAPINSTKPY